MLAATYYRNLIELDRINQYVVQYISGMMLSKKIEIKKLNKKKCENP